MEFNYNYPKIKNSFYLNLIIIIIIIIIKEFKNRDACKRPHHGVLCAPPPLVSPFVFFKHPSSCLPFLIPLLFPLITSLPPTFNPLLVVLLLTIVPVHILLLTKLPLIIPLIIIFLHLIFWKFLFFCRGI